MEKKKRCLAPKVAIASPSQKPRIRRTFDSKVSGHPFCFLKCRKIFVRPQSVRLENPTQACLTRLFKQAHKPDISETRSSKQQIEHPAKASALQLLALHFVATCERRRERQNSVSSCSNGSARAVSARSISQRGSLAGSICAAWASFTVRSGAASFVTLRCTLAQIHRTTAAKSSNLNFSTKRHGPAQQQDGSDSMPTARRRVIFARLNKPEQLLVLSVLFDWRSTRQAARRFDLSHSTSVAVTCNISGHVNWIHVLRPNFNKHKTGPRILIFDILAQTERQNVKTCIFKTPKRQDTNKLTEPAGLGHPPDKSCLRDKSCTVGDGNLAEEDIPSSNDSKPAH